MKLEGQWIVLTGATGGIGEAIAQALYRKGANLVLVGRDPERLEHLINNHSFSSDRTTTIVADINQSAGHLAAVDACQRLSLPVSILINNAGISDFSLFDEQDDQKIINLLKTNLLAPVLLTKKLLPLLRRTQPAMIVNIGSTFGSIGYPGFAAYSASKFGFRGFSEALRRELANTHIKVCYIAPRATRTPINSDAVNHMNAELGNAMDDPVTVAAMVVKAIEKETPSTYIGWPEKLFVKINQLLPGIVDGALYKQLPIITRYSQQRQSS